ncbi:MAG: hypothetical protein ABIX01_05050 [Chitinophagaceae bacterium]
MAAKSPKIYFIIALLFLITIVAIQYFYFKKLIAQKQALVQLVQVNLERSNNTIGHLNENTLFGFQQKMKQPELLVKAELWYPRISETQRIVAAMHSLLMESGKSEHSTKTDRLELLDSLKGAVAKMLDAIPLAMRNRVPRLPLQTLLEKTDDGKENGFNKRMVAAVNDEDWKFLLLKLRNDLLISGSIAMAFCDEQVYTHAFIDDRFEPLISQNSTILEPGQNFELLAGIGVFSSAANPKIFINEKEIKLTDYGYAAYKKVVAANDPGIVNVKIQYKDPNTGQTMIKRKTVTYKVLKP